MAQAGVRIGTKSRSRVLEIGATVLLLVVCLSVAGGFTVRWWLNKQLGNLLENPLGWNSRRVGLLVRWGADANLRCPGGHTPLAEAAMHRDANLVKELLARGARVDELGVGGSTALMLASEHANALPLVHFLLANGANPNLRTSNAETPLSLAAMYGGPRIIGELLAHGAALEPRDLAGRTPLLLAALVGNPGSVRVLAEHGASVTALDSNGDGPLALARDGRRMNWRSPQARASYTRTVLLLKRMHASAKAGDPQSAVGFD